MYIKYIKYKNITIYYYKGCLQVLILLVTRNGAYFEK